jgi:pSer/pThr/pTyr-binding forkhead associated (FHA) protein
MLAVIILILRYLAMVCLFLFLGWVVLTQWRELKFQSQVVATRKVPAIILIMESGQEVVRQEFSKPDVIIGREDDCDFIIKDEVVSSHHARLFYKSSQWWIEDLNSTNGSYLNDERVEAATVVIKGDELRTGHQIVAVEIQSS